MMIAASTTSIAQVGIKEWLFATTPDICTAANSNSLTCPQMRSFFTASVLWYVLKRNLSFDVTLITSLLSTGVSSALRGSLVLARSTITACTLSLLAASCPSPFGCTCVA